jgi:hypothetical protein
MCKTLVSSDLERFKIVILGYSAFRINNLLDSLFEPEIDNTEPLSMFDFLSIKLIKLTYHYCGAYHDLL